ncbi:MAG: cupredoxin domain-containing protein [Nitrospirales bacterium]|nr:cupredoxin domain-containing protein [Nitrospirales bacterium]
MLQHIRRVGEAKIGMLIGCVLMMGVAQVSAQPEQHVEVFIKDFTFRTTQMPLQLNAATVIHVKNEDNVRHDFGSAIFQDSSTRVENEGVITYGDNIGGAFIDPGREVTFRFVIERPGRYQFQCSIHSDMKGEILLLSVGAV